MCLLTSSRHGTRTQRLKVHTHTHWYPHHDLLTHRNSQHLARHFIHKLIRTTSGIHRFSKNYKNSRFYQKETNTAVCVRVAMQSAHPFLDPYAIFTQQGGGKLDRYKGVEDKVIFNFSTVRILCSGCASKTNLTIFVEDRVQLPGFR